MIKLYSLGRPYSCLNLYMEQYFCKETLEINELENAKSCHFRLKAQILGERCYEQ